MKKTVGVFSLIVMLLSQVFSPFAYAVSGENVPVDEVVVEEPVVPAEDTAVEVDVPVGETETVEASQQESEIPAEHVVVVNSGDQNGTDLNTQNGSGNIGDNRDVAAVNVQSGTTVGANSGNISKLSCDNENLKEEQTEEKTENGLGEESKKGFIGTIKNFLGLGKSKEEGKEQKTYDYETQIITGEAEYDDVKVEVYADTGLFYSGTKLVIQAVTGDMYEGVKEVLSGQLENISEEEQTVVAFDISFIYSGEEVQPLTGTVQVMFNYENNENLKAAEENDEQEVKVYHLNDKDEEGEKIEEITGAKVEEVVINEEKSEDENVLVVEAESFSVYTIVKQIAEEGPNASKNQLANFEYGMISIARPDSLKDEFPDILGFTLMDRNLGALSNDVNSSNSYGYYYQRGNNYGFDEAAINNEKRWTCELAKRDDKYLTDGYSSKNLFTCNSKGWNYWEDGYHDGLWGGSGDSSDNGWGILNNNLQGRQGPCPEGWHVPSAGEWGVLFRYWASLNNADWTGENNLNTILSDADGFLDYFKIPFAGYINVEYDRASVYHSASNLNDYSMVVLQTSSPAKNEVKYYNNSNEIEIDDYIYLRGGNMRCFKNVYEPGNIHTVTFDYKGGKGSVASINVEDGGKVLVPTKPVKDLSIFSGWYLSGTDELFDFTGTEIKEDIQLYAKWNLIDNVTMLKVGTELNDIFWSLSNPGEEREYFSINGNAGLVPIGGDDIPIGGSVVPIGGSVVPIGGSVVPIGGSVIPIGGDDSEQGTDEIYATSDKNIRHIVRYVGNNLPESKKKISLEGYVDAYAWYSGDNTIYYHTDADKIYLNADSSFMFYGLESLLDIDLFNFDTSYVRSMMWMFSLDLSLFNLDLTTFDTSNVTSMVGMFFSSSNLKTIYVNENFNVDNVNDSYFMFQNVDLLVGGNGTYFDDTKSDKTYAVIDNQVYSGYFTDPSHFAIRFKNQGGEEITTQWIATGGTAQALTGRYMNYNYYTGADLEHEYDLNTPLYAYTEIYASGINAYEVKFYSGDEVIYTGYVTGDNNSKLSIPTAPIKEGYDFLGWTVGSTSDLFNFDEIVTSDLELHANWENPNQGHIGTTGCYDYRSYYEGGEYLAEITNYRKDTVSCLGNNLTLPDVIQRNGRDYKVVSLGENSFKEKGISGLLTLPQYLKVIENMAFIGNSDLTGIVFNENLESIGTQSFQLCGIKSLSFPASLRSIGSIAFYGCSIENVTIPSNVTSIGQQAFEDNPLKTVRVLSENVTIGGSAFKAKNNSIETLVLSGGGDLTYLMFGNDGETIFNNLTSLKLGNGVTKIGNDLFKKTKLQNVRIPGSVKLLDSNSFASNDYVEEIIIEEGLEKIHPGVFSNNKIIKRFVIPNSVKEISGATFNKNPELESIKFGSGVKHLEGLLNDCPKLKYLDLGNVEEIYSSISGTQIESLTIPASMVIIGPSTFAHNPNLTSLVFEGNSLITIWTGAFNDTSITNVLLPNSLTTLGNGAFCSDSVKEPGSIIGVVSGATAAQIESLEAQDNTECLVLKKDKYTLTYNAGAHSGLVDNQQTLGVVVDYNGTIQLTGNGSKTAISQKGYTFLGWTTELNGTTPLAINTYTITGDVTLYPVFKKDLITKRIKFYKNGNEGYTYSGNDYTEDQEFILCTIQERYNADEDVTTCSENIEFPMGISENTPVTKGWTRNIGGDGMLYTGGEQIEVSSEDSTISYYLQMYAPEKVFKANYEYGSGVEELTITSGSCMIAETINGNVQSGSCEVVLPELNALTGYHTPMWYKKGEDITYSGATITLTGDIILEAKAIANNYTVVYQPGEGTGEMESQEFEYDKEESLNKNKYRKEGYHFSGWIDMLGKEYRDGEKVLNLLTEGVLELTAQWLQNPPAAGGGQSIIPATKEQEHNAAEENPEDKQESNQDKQQDETVKDETVKDESKTPENTNTSNQTNTQQSSSTSPDNSYKTVVDPEIQSAYEWAYERDVTTIPSLDDAMPDGVVKRGHLAKMVVNYATNVLGREIPEKIPSECRWNDWRKDRESEEIKDYAVKSCALGLMGLDMPKFLPNMEVTRAQFGTIMSRLLWGKKYAGGTPYYRKHLNALRENNIMTQIENPERRVELRQWVWLMLMRSAENN